MPLLSGSTYRPCWLYRRVLPSTTFPTLFRRPPAVPLERRRIETDDGDFLDVDLARAADPGATRRTVVLCHGLEGHSRRNYMLGMAHAFLVRGWDIAAMNHRGCSGEPNRGPGSYHAGATDDVRRVIEATCGDGEVALVGFSMGGNMVLKLLGEDGEASRSRVRAAVAFSVPVDLGAGCDELCRPKNRLYHERFMRRLRHKIHVMATRHPDRVDASHLSRIRNLRDFDDHYTGPLHGFADANDYYANCSSRRFLAGIRVPALLANAANDPFLAPSCYPRAEAEASPWLHLEIPPHGGHVGFHLPGPEYWSELRAVEFISAAPPAGDQPSR